MEEIQIRRLLEHFLKREDPPFYKPTEEDWKLLTSKYDWKLPESFKVFLDLTSEYVFEGDLLNVADHPKGNGNDTIELTYLMEVENGLDERMVPFLSIGNGDYLCLNGQEGESSSVYCFDHENGEITLEYQSFDEWLHDFEEWI